MAGWLMYRLGYGQMAIVDPENPDNPPSVTATVSAPVYDTFTRIMQGQIENTEEMRRDAPVSFVGSFEYIGVATAGSNTGALVWDVVRVTWSGNKKVRYQFRENIAWDDRALGW